ncbi:MAG: Ppx/GppA phosphatase family protein [Gaiellaceae bacterium]
MSDIAAIDIGTNSIHLVVARPTPNRRFDVLAREKEVVRLGSGSGDMKHLSAEAIDRAVATLDRFRQVAETWDAQVAAVATSATREALNRQEFLTRARDEAGVDVAVISGMEEARLIHLGVLQAVPVYDRDVLVIDIGGGSTELIVGSGGKMRAARSLKLGAIRLTDRFFADEPTEPENVEACRAYVRAFLNPVVRRIRRAGFSVTVGSSGTIGSVVAMSVAQRGESPRSLNAVTVTRDELDAVVASLVEATTAAERERLPGLESKRSDIILAGVILLEQLTKELGVEELTFSEYALREGVLLDRMRQPHEGLHHLSDLRQESVLHVARMFVDDLQHATATAELAADIWEQTESVHELPAQTLELLEAAALLHNVGLFVSHSAHHRHSYYLIRNCEHLTGFTDREIELIAQVARYHRKSPPKAKHEEFANLTADDQQHVRVMAGILRIAIALDRTASGVVDSVAVQREGKELAFRVAIEAGADGSLELYTAEQRKDMLEEALGRKITVGAASRRAVA